MFVDDAPNTVLPGCEHCPPGVICDPTTGACIKGKYSDFLFHNCANHYARNAFDTIYDNVLLFCDIIY